jgi:bisphosphoglycerate-dependent phosphoglycerate mutase
MGNAPTVSHEIPADFHNNPEVKEMIKDYNSAYDNTNTEATDNPKFLIGTHNYRLKCFTNWFYSQCGMNGSKLGYQNGAFIICTVTLGEKESHKGFNLHLKMIYAGMVDPSEKKDLEDYYTKDHFNKIFNELKPFIKLKNGIEFKEKTFEIILFRHGQGLHNKHKKDKKWYNRNGDTFLDSPLTNFGKVQAYLTGSLFKKYLGDKQDKIQLLGASRLKRTMETVGIIYEVVSDKQLPIYIIPCVHEIPVEALDGKCDGTYNWKNWGSGAGENTSRCVDTKYKYTRETTCNSLALDLPNIIIDVQKINNNPYGYAHKNAVIFTIDWTIYEKFYNVLSRFKCQETNIIEEILKAYNTTLQNTNEESKKYKYLKYKQKYLMLKEKYFNKNL